MSIQKIMVPFLSEGAGKAAFKAAAIMADRFKAHLDVVHMRQHITTALAGSTYYPIAANYVEDNIDALRAAANQQADQLRNSYEQLCQEHDVGFFDEAEHTDDKGATAAWTDVEAKMPFDLANRARVADLTVFGRSTGDAPAHEYDTIEEVLFQSGRSVLLVDSQRQFLRFPETVFVAWNGGREAARALSAALPILKHAKLVIIITVGDLPWGVEPPEHVSSYLRLHGVHATHLNARLEKGADAEEEFLAHAEKKNADLIVMGAYSRNRWREVILGGFTRHLLKRSSIPLLMTH